MKNKIFLAILLLTPILVVTFSSLYFALGYSPEGTKNNGEFFKSYFNFDQFNNVKDEELIKFDDGKWVMGVYITNISKSKESIYLMRQLNVALNRDIYKVKRVAFFSNQKLKNEIDNLIKEYPRTELVNDKNGVLKAGKTEFEEGDGMLQIINLFFVNVFICVLFWRIYFLII